MEEKDKIEVYCNCGKKLNPNWKVCPQCNTPVFSEEIEKTKEKALKRQVQQQENAEYKGITLFEIIVLVAIIAFLLFITPHVITWAIKQK